MSSRLRKLSLVFGLIAVFAGSSAAQSIQVEGLTEEDINTSYQDDGVRFTTDYLNKTVEYKDLFVPGYLHDDLNNFKAQYQGQGNQEKLQVQFKFKQAQKDGDGDMPRFLSQYQYQATQQVNPGQTQFQVQSSLDVDDLGNGTSLEEDADYDFQSQQNNEQLQIDGSLNRKLDGQQLLNDVSLNFSKRAGEFAFDSGVIKPDVSSHYEHLIVNHTVRNSVSPEYGRSVNTTETVFSGNDTERLPASGNLVKYERNGEYQDRASLTYDRLYEEEKKEVTVVVIHDSDRGFRGFTASQGAVENIPSNGVFDSLQSQAEQVNASGIVPETLDGRSLKAWNISVPADSETGFEAFTESPKGVQQNMSMYILGSFAGGSGTSSDPYQIETCQQLQDISSQSSSSFELVSNLDCGTFTPVDLSSSGVFNGQGYSISNLDINDDSGDVGMFSVLDGTAKNFQLLNIDVDASDYAVGSVAGELGTSGEVKNVYVTGSVDVASGFWHGGVIGAGGGGRLENVISEVDINGANQVGGIAGDTGQFARTYFDNVIAAGSVSGDSEVSAIQGANDDNGYSFTAVYYDSSVTGVSSTFGATGLSTSQLTGSSVKTNTNLDFTNDWCTRDGDYPGLDALGQCNSPPQASFTSNEPVLTDNDLGLDASDSSDPDGDSLSYSWDFNQDGTFEGSGVSPSKSFSDNGNFDITLKISDGSATDTVTNTVTVENRNPSASFIASTSNKDLSVDGTGSSDQDGSVSQYEWDWTNDGTFEGSGSTASHTYSSGGSYTVKLRVTDDDGATATTTTSVTVNKDPVLAAAEFIDDRQSGVTDLVFTLDDRTESDISGFTAAFTASTFTNSTLRGGVSLPFSDTVSVSDFPGALGSRSVDISETDSGLQERSGFGHTLATQRIERQLTISNGDSNSINYSLTTDLPGGTVIQGQSFTGTISGSSSVTETSITESDFITSESEVADRFEDAGFDQTEDTQQFINETDLVVDNTQSHSFTGVDISSQCSSTTSTDVPSGSDVTATGQCNIDTFTGDFISTSVSSEFGDATVDHTLDSQGVAKQKNLTNTKGFEFSGVTISEPSLSGTVQNGGQRDVTLAGGETGSEFFNATGDFISNERENTFIEAQNTSMSSSVASQAIFNQTELVVDNAKSFQFGSVDISNRCSLDTAADVPAGSSAQVTTQCNNQSFTVDRVDETNFDFEPAANQIVLGENYTGRRPVEFENTAANINFSNLDTAPGVNTPGACTQTNASTVGVNAGNSKNQSVEFDCDPGTPGTPQKEIIPNQPATGFETVEYKTTAVVETNKTKNRPIIWQIDKSNLNDFNEREGGTLEATVDGQTRNVSVFDFPDMVEVRVNTDFGNSSLESGSHDMEVRYSYTVDSPGGGGGGGGGGAPEEESRTAVTFDLANVTAQPNSTGTSDFTIQNQLAEPLEVTVEVPENNECRGFYLLNGSKQSQRQTYNVEGSTNSITGFRDVSYGFDAGADFVEPRSCEVRVGLPASAGSAGELVLTAEPEAGLVTELVVFLEDSFNVDLQQVRTLEVPLFSFESGEVENREVEYTGVQVLFVLGGAVAVYLVYVLFFRSGSSSEN